MSDKFLSTTYQKSGAILYDIIRRNSDGMYMDNSDGIFKSLPISNMFKILTEDSIIKSFYYAIENRILWDNGTYLITSYEQVSGSPSLSGDLILGSYTMEVRNNEEYSRAVFSEEVINNIHSYATSHTHYVTGGGDIVVDYGTLVSGTWQDVLSFDNRYMIIGELGTNPISGEVLQVTIDFTLEVDDNPYSFIFDGRYQHGIGLAHYVEVFAYSWFSNQWDKISTDLNFLDDSDIDYHREFLLNNSHIEQSTGRVRIRFMHNPELHGHLGDYLYINRVMLASRTVSTTLKLSDIENCETIQNVHDSIFGKSTVDLTNMVLTLYKKDGTLLKTFTIVDTNLIPKTIVERIPL